MRFTPPDEDVVVYETVFENDFLDRIKVSKTLSGIVDRIEDPLVIAVDGKWGTGKSYFLKRWAGAHKIQNDGKANVIYFDAFENDYLSDPLTSIVGLVAERTPGNKPTLPNRLKTLAYGLAAPAVRIGLSIATAGASSVLSELGDAGIDALSKEAQQAIDQHWAKEQGRQAAMLLFRETLSALTTSENGETTPLVVVIDELDRCRPDYALSVLETIKHFFSVPNVHFVLGVNFTTLEDIVRVRYGNNVDSGAYLRKFVSFSLNLPNHIGDHDKTPASVVYFQKVISKMELPKRISRELLEQIQLLTPVHDLSIRDVGKILSTAAILPQDALTDDNYATWRAILVTLIIAKVTSPNLFRKLVELRATVEEMKEFLGAQDERIKSTLVDGQENQNFSRDTLHLYGIWHYAMTNGKTPNGLEIPPLDRAFDRFGGRELHRIPATIHSAWLSVIELK